MNVYDFDKTIYKGDATVDIYLFAMRKDPKLLLSVPRNALNALRFKLGVLGRSEFKERFLQSFLCRFDAPELSREFWESRRRRIQRWYLEQRKDDDVVISASPEIFLRPICNELGITVIGTEIDSSGRLAGPNLRGEEKVAAFRDHYGQTIPDAFYSDSLSDLPMMLYARRAYLVLGEHVQEYRTIDG